MDLASLINLIVTIVSGGAGGNIAGALMKDKSLGGLWNTIIGILGGAGGQALLGALTGGAAAAATGTPDLASIIKDIATSGISGGAIVGIIAWIKNAMNKS